MSYSVPGIYYIDYSKLMLSDTENYYAFCTTSKKSKNKNTIKCIYLPSCLTTNILTGSSLDSIISIVTPCQSVEEACQTCPELFI